MVGLKKLMVTYAKISPKMVNTRDIVGEHSRRRSGTLSSLILGFEIIIPLFFGLDIWRSLVSKLLIVPFSASSLLCFFVEESWHCHLPTFQGTVIWVLSSSWYCPCSGRMVLTFKLHFARVLPMPVGSLLNMLRTGLPRFVCWWIDTECTSSAFYTFHCVYISLPNPPDKDHSRKLLPSPLHFTHFCKNICDFIGYLYWVNQPIVMILWTNDRQYSDRYLVGSDAVRNQQVPSFPYISWSKVKLSESTFSCLVHAV